MDMMLSKEEKKNQVKAGIGTSVIMLLLLLLLFLLGFKAAEIEDTSDSGVMVQLGEPNQGGPDNSPATERTVPVSPKSSEPTENNVTTNQDDAVNIKNTPDPKPNTTQQTDPTPEPPKIETALEKAMREAREGKQSRGQGDGTEKGTQGQPDGTGTSPTGGNTGTGNQGTGDDDKGIKLGKGFGNRGISFAPNIRSSCINAKGGKVIFKVEVSQSGTIIQVFNPSTGERGSNVADPCLMREALDLVKQVKLTPQPGGGNTIGEIVINIKN